MVCRYEKVTRNSRPTIRSEIGIRYENATVPTASSVNMLASVAYATELMTSLLKTASAFHFGSRCSSSSCVDRTRPNTRRRAPKPRRAARRSGSIAAALATIVPSGPRRK